MCVIKIMNIVMCGNRDVTEVNTDWNIFSGVWSAACFIAIVITSANIKWSLIRKCPWLTGILKVYWLTRRLQSLFPTCYNRGRIIKNGEFTTTKVNIRTYAVDCGVVFASVCTYDKCSTHNTNTKISSLPFVFNPMRHVGRDSSVGIATG